MPPFLLHVLVYADGEEWLAQCLDFDTVAQGATPARARKGLEDALDLLIEDAMEHHDLPGLFRPAPRDLWSKYAEVPEKGRSAFRKIPRRDLALDTRLVPA